MVSRTTIGKSFDGLVRYQYTGRRDQPADKQAEILASSGVSEESAAEMISDFNLGRAVNPRLGYPVWHTSLSFNPDDAARLDSDKMRAIAEGYLQKMGLDNTQYVIVRHHDQPDNQHLHIIANRVGYDGKTIDDGRNFYRSKLALQELIAEHDLTPIKGQRPELQHPERLRGTDLARHEMLTIVNQTVAAETQRPHLLTALQTAGIRVEERFDKSGKATGISFEKNGYKFKGNELGRHLSSAGIDKQLAANELKHQTTVTVSEPRAGSRPPVSAALSSSSRSMSASTEKVGSVKLPEVPTGQPSVEVSALAATMVRETAGDRQASVADQQATAERNRLREQAVAAVNAVQRKKELIASYKDEANQADRRDDVARMAELRFETIPAAEKRLSTYEAEANSTSIGRELLVKQNELQPEKVQKNGSRVLEEQAVVPAVPESQVIAISTQQPATVPAGNEEVPIAGAALAATPPVALPQAVVMPTEQKVLSVSELQQGLTTEGIAPPPIAKVDDRSREPVPTASLSDRETKGLIVNPHDTTEASQPLPTQRAAPRQADEEAAKEALAGMRKEQVLLEATEKDLKLADSAVDIMQMADLRYRLLPEIAQRLADYRKQAEATPVGRELLAELDQAQTKSAEQTRLIEQERQKAEEARVAEQRAAQAAVEGVRKERALLETSRREATQAERQGDADKERNLRGDTIPQAERRLTDYQVQVEATELGRTLLARLNEQEKAEQRAAEVLSQLAAKWGFVSYIEFGQKADESGYTLPLKLYGQPQQVVEKSSGLQFAVPLIDGQPLEKIVDKAIRMEENARLHQKTEMRKLEIACAEYTRYSGKEVVRVRVAADQVAALQKRVGSGAIADKEAGSDGRIGMSIIYNPSSGASMVGEVVARVKKSGGEVFELPEQAVKRARSAQAFASSIAIDLGKESGREMGS